MFIVNRRDDAELCVLKEGDHAPIKITATIGGVAPEAGVKQALPVVQALTAKRAAKKWKRQR